MPATQQKQPSEWRSSYLAEADKERTAAERGRSAGALMVIAALFVAVGCILKYVDEAFPYDIVTYCGLIALLGIGLFVVAGRRHRLGNWQRAAIGILPCCLMLAVLAGAAGAVGYFVIYPQRVWRREAATFTCVEDHLDFMLRQSNAKLRQLAEDALYETYTPEEIENGYVSADLRAIVKGDFSGKGFAICTARNPEDRMAVVTFKNVCHHPLAIVLEGPSSQKLVADSQQITSAHVKPGDYTITVSLDGKYVVPAVSAPKRIINGGNYKAVIAISRDRGFFTASTDLKKKWEDFHKSPKAEAPAKAEAPQAAEAPAPKAEK